VKERRGAIGRATGIAEGVAATVRRIARDREPRVMLYSADGYARLLQPESRGHDQVLEVGEQMVELVNTVSGERRRPQDG
jgi:hypothetical protein